METVKNRRSIRKYAGKPVDEELLRRLLEVSERTQTMGNMQLYSVVVTRSEEMKKRLAPAHFNQPMVTQAPVILTICADFNRTVKWAEQRKAQPGYDNFLSFLNAATDALLFTQTFCNLAEAEGLGICYLGTTLYMPSQIIDILQLPRLVMPVAPMAYLNKMLKVFREKGITTMEAAKAERERFEQQPSQSTAPAARAPKVVGEQQYTQRTYTPTQDAMDAMMQEWEESHA